MRSRPESRFMRMNAMKKQRGVVLFFTLVALVAMMLAAVALIRSVDTSTLIAGNIAFKQAATSSGDAGIEAAMTWLSNTQAANSGVDVLTDPTHPFNVTGGTGAYLNAGYYSNADPTVSLTDGTGIVWDNTDSTLVGTDSSGNTIRYVIQRMCRTANQPVQSANCLFSSAVEDQNGKNIPLPQDICQGAGCPVAGQAPMIRITSRTTGPRSTVSYVQSFVY
jgi:type IV pilus assembly protein PilX